MMDDNKNDGPERPIRSGLGGLDASRGPRLGRGVVLLVVFLFFSVVVIKMVSDGRRTLKDMTFSEFQARWNETQKKYVGFDRAELSDDILLLREAEPENAESATTTVPKPAEKPAAKPAEKAAPKDAAKKDTTALVKAEVWYRVRVPEIAVDREFLQQLATIPKFEFKPANRVLLSVLWNVFLLIAFVFAFYFLLIRPLRMQGGPGNVLSFGRSRPKLITKEQTRVKFVDVAGIEEAKEEVTEVIEFLKNPQKFHKLGGRIPRGLLFVGPPGTGKTLLAKAIAGEADVPFFSICGSDFVEMFVGVGASRVRDLFRQAKENAPCIIFLDEVDAVGRRRGSGLGGGHDEREQTLNAILVEMDGFDTNEQVIVIAATNRPDVLDPALLRPGRFDREVVINLPDLKGRYEILKVHARHIKMSDKVDMMKIARGTPMFSGADLEALINEAAIRATMNQKETVEQDDFEEARDKVRFGREKRSVVVDQHEREITAYHEAGHAIATKFCSDCEPLHKVTIIPRGMAGGMTMMLPAKDRYNYSRNQLLGQIKMMYAGRIAEQIFFNEITTGASNDIERASQLARRMVCEFGMSDELGPIRYATKEQQVFLGGEMVAPRDFSEATSNQIDAAVRILIDRCYKEADELLRAHKDDTELLAKALLVHETLSAEEVDKILEARDIHVVVKLGKNGKPVEDAKAAAEANGNGPPIATGGGAGDNIQTELGATANN